jgi:hypothetical protein
MFPSYQRGVVLRTSHLVAEQTRSQYTLQPVRLLDQLRDLIRLTEQEVRRVLAETQGTFRTVPELLGHKDVSTTMIYTHVLNKGGPGVKSPLDRTS